VTINLYGMVSGVVDTLSDERQPMHKCLPVFLYCSMGLYEFAEQRFRERMKSRSGCDGTDISTDGFKVWEIHSSNAWSRDRCPKQILCLYTRAGIRSVIFGVDVM
jgi:hypothetical protein